MFRSSPRIKIASFFVLLLTCLLACGFLTSCGQDNEKLIRDSLTEELDDIKNLDPAYLEELTSDPNVSQLESFGIDPEEFVTSYLTGFDYRIDDVTVNGDTATATVVLTTKSFSQFNDALNDATTDLLNDESIYSMSMDEIYQVIGQTVMDVLDGLPTNETDPLTLDYELIDKTWTPTAASQSMLESALMSN